MHAGNVQCKYVLKAKVKEGCGSWTLIDSKSLGEEIHYDGDYAEY